MWSLSGWGGWGWLVLIFVQIYITGEYDFERKRPLPFQVIRLYLTNTISEVVAIFSTLILILLQIYIGFSAWIPFIAGLLILLILYAVLGIVSTITWEDPNSSGKAVHSATTVKE